MPFETIESKQMMSKRGIHTIVNALGNIKEFTLRITYLTLLISCFRVEKMKCLPKIN